MTEALSTKDSRALMQLTPQRWEEARNVLTGAMGDRVSWAAAAKAAHVTVRTLRAWVTRSAEKHPEDEPWIHEIAEICSEVDELQAGVLEDKLWDHAVNGVDEPVFQGGELVGHKTKHDHKLALRMLEVRDQRYKPRPSTQLNFLAADPNEILTRLRAATRMKQIKETGE